MLPLCTCPSRIRPATHRLTVRPVLHSFEQGYGTFESPDGARYTGNWAANLKHGIGKKTYANGDSYEGLWCSGKADGPGRCEGRARLGLAGCCCAAPIMAVCSIHESRCSWRDASNAARSSWHGSKRAAVVLPAVACKLSGLCSTLPLCIPHAAPCGSASARAQQHSLYVSPVLCCLLVGCAVLPCRYVWHNGNQYDGEWRVGKMHGQGTLKWVTGGCAGWGA